MSDVPEIRSEGSDFLRVAEATGGDAIMEGDDGATGVGGCGAGAATGVGAGGCADDTPSPGGSVGSEGSGNGAPFVATVAGLADAPATAVSGAVGGCGGLMPNEVGSRSTV
jgi:hypothetical protein